MGETDDKKVCNCLEKESKNGDNVIVQSYSEQTQENLPNQIAKNRLNYTKRFLDVYSQMTIESEAQKRVMKIPKKSDETHVGCSPDNISKKVDKDIRQYSEKQKTDLRKLLTEIEKQLGQCNNQRISKDSIACEPMERQKKSLASEISRLETIENYKCDASLMMFATSGGLAKVDANINKLNEARDEIIKKLEALKKKYHKSTDRGEKNLLEIEQLNIDKNVRQVAVYSRLSVLLASFISDTSSTKETIYDRLKEFFLRENGTRMGYKTGNTLQDPCADFKIFNDEFLNAELAGSAPISNCKEDIVCEAFEDENTKLQAELKGKFDFNPEKECISFAEFKTFKSMPSNELLDKLVNDEKGKLLLTPKSATTTIEIAQAEFLRSNPMISRLATTNKVAHKELTAAFIDFAKNVPSTTPEHQKFSAYLTFMQMKVGPILQRHDDNSTAAVCQIMSDNFTAIQVARDVPNMSSPKVSNNEKLFAQIESCLLSDHNRSTTTNLGATLQTSPIFSLGDAKRLDTEKEDFETMKKSFCQGYEVAQVTCLQKKISADDCRLSFLHQTDWANIVPVLREEKFSSTLSTEDLNHIKDKTDPTKQNKAFHNNWDKDTGSKLKSGILATRGDEAKYESDRENDQTVLSSRLPSAPFAVTPSSVSAVIPSTSSSSTSSTASSFESKNESSQRNQGQDTPSFVDVPQKANPSFNPNVLNNAKSVSDVISNFDQSPPEKKAEYLKEINDYVAESSATTVVSPELIKDLQKEASETAKEVAELPKSPEESIVSPAAKATAAVATVTQPSSVVGMYPSFRSPSTTSSTNSATGLAKKEIYGTVNDVLTKVYEERESTEKGRNIASVDQRPQIIVQSSEADVSNVKEPFLISEHNEIKADDYKSYTELKTDPDKLAKFLSAKVNLANFKQYDVISIKDPTLGSDSHMLFKVSKGKNNILLFESWPPQARVSSLRDLKLNLAPAIKH